MYRILGKLLMMHGSSGSESTISLAIRPVNTNVYFDKTFVSALWLLSGPETTFALETRFGPSIYVVWDPSAGT
jgi:hypothetical protein